MVHSRSALAGFLAGCVLALFTASPPRSAAVVSQSHARRSALQVPAALVGGMSDIVAPAFVAPTFVASAAHVGELAPKHMPELLDFEAPGNFSYALRRRSYDRQIILMLSDQRYLHWAFNALLNLEELGLHHHLLIGSSASVCSDYMLGLPHVARGCGTSSFLRRSASNEVNRSLDRWKIHDEHPYHLWWQRWRYIERAVALGYAVLSIDTDISLRHDPFPVLRGPLRHHKLVVSVESEQAARVNRFRFPVINAGFVYCQGRAGGAAHWAVAEVVRRIEALLYSSPPAFCFKREEPGQPLQFCLVALTSCSRTHELPPHCLSSYASDRIPVATVGPGAAQGCDRVHGIWSLLAAAHPLLFGRRG